MSRLHSAQIKNKAEPPPAPWHFDRWGQFDRVNMMWLKKKKIRSLQNLNHVKAHGGHVLARLCPAQRFIIQHHGQWRRPQGQAPDLWLLYWDYWLGHMASRTEITAGLLSNVTRVKTPFHFYICYDHLKAAYGSEKPVPAPSLSLPAALLSSPRQPPLESSKVSAALTHLEQQNWLSESE